MRIGRLGFVLGNVPLVAMAYWHDAVGAHVFHQASPDVAGRMVLVAYLFGAIFLTVLRCHDFNETVWGNFWTEQIPIVGQFLALGELLIKPGTVGPNSYGSAPFV
jgi:uncharacterized membrane protein YhaH (DUF805 family)